MAYTTRQERCPLGEIETWIFDLDNTLYPASCRLFDQVQHRMNEYICTRLAVSEEQAAELILGSADLSILLDTITTLVCGLDGAAGVRRFDFAGVFARLRPSGEP